MRDHKQITLFSPGPVPMSQKSLQIMGQSPIHHRSKAFQESLKNAHCMLSGLFKTPNCFAFTSTGTGGLESSVVNLLSSDDYVLALEGGKFGERWKEIFSAYGVKNKVISFDWGDTPPEEEVEEALKNNKFKAVYMQACETSTGTKYDLVKIVELIKKHSPETLLVVDGITAVGAYPLSIEDGVDVLITGSQKALSLATGLSLIGLSDKALKACSEASLPKYYFNYLEELKCLNAGSTRFSSPTQLWLSLEEELKNFENREEKFSHCLHLQEMMFNWCEKEGLKLFSKNPSPSLTAVKTPEGLTSSLITKNLLEKGYFVAGGQAEFKEKIFRVGHMGHISFKMMEDFLNTFSKVLKDLKA